MLQQMENVRHKEACQLWLPSRSHSKLHLKRHLGDQFLYHFILAAFHHLMAEMTLPFEVTSGTYKGSRISPVSFPLNF